MADGGAAAALDGAGGGGSAHERLQEWAVWPSKQDLFAEVAGVSETLGRSVRVASSNRRYIMIKCTSAECSFRVSAKTVNFEGQCRVLWVSARSTLGRHTSRAQLPRCGGDARCPGGGAGRRPYHGPARWSAPLVCHGRHERRASGHVGTAGAGLPATAVWRH